VKTNFGKEIPRKIDYPDSRQPILDWWAGYYDRVFIAYNPFYRVKAPADCEPRFLRKVNGVDFVDPSIDLPDRIHLLENTLFKANSETINWEDIYRDGFEDYSYRLFCRAAWIGSCLGYREDVPKALQDRLFEYCTQRAIFFPDDDVMSDVSEIQIGRYFSALGVTEVQIFDEFRDNVFDVPIANFLSPEISVFCPEAVTSQGVYGIHAQDLGVFMCWAFDGVEGILGVSNQSLLNAQPERFFEGHYVDASVYSDWLNDPEGDTQRRPAK